MNQLSSNEEYHANRTHLSSSLLKLIMKDPHSFVKFWVHGIKKDIKRDYLDEGALLHTLVLEPHKVNEEYAFYDGLRRAGAGWQQFLEQNGGKKCMSAPQKIRADELFNAVKRLPELLKLCTGGAAEFTILGEYMGVPVKVRPDYINWDQGYIVDLKTTSYPADIDVFRETIQFYDYDLSAALYCKVAEQAFGKPFKFYFAPISKPDKKADVYRASALTMHSGEAKMLEAVSKFKQLKARNWVIEVERDYNETTDYEFLEV